ncbi:hypothetical protein RN001_014186 [Aquatica leii]|uniref:Uncharacterized protein n=1 Tax=Aquatica leii TaxID=1421715 RepID=A0AAN7P3W7_9COLE|nr:hypothetical protein RN001_014186 [Aquatica leii]
MKTLLLTFFFVSVQSVVLLPKFTRQCMRDTNLTIEMLSATLANDNMKNQMYFKKYLACVYQHNNLLTNDGNVNLLSFIEPHRKLVDQYEKCQKLNAPNLCDRASELHECLRDVQPTRNNIPVFY